MPEQPKESVKDVAVAPIGAYYSATTGRPPRATVLAALAGFAAEGRPPGLAVDLGCGAGRDTLPLLVAGWRVLAIDREPEALARLQAACAPKQRARLQTRLGSIEAATLPPVDLVVASFSLFFATAAELEATWAGIRACLRPGGRLAAQLLGPEDDWVRGGQCAGVARAEVDRLLGEFAIERLEEERSQAVTPRGEAKAWHLWHVVARAPGAITTR